jgi:PAS domain S-box-containing protein
LGIHTRQRRNFDRDDLNFVQAIANILAAAIASKAQKKARQASEQRFRNTFEQAAVGITHVAPDGRWLQVNEKLCQIVGYAKEELLQKTFQEITYPDDLTLDLKYVQQMLIGKIQTCSLEKRYIRRDRAIVWVNLTVSLVKDALGNPDYFIAVVENISQRKNLELSLQRSLRRLENLHQIDRAILEAQKTEAIAQIAIGNIQQLVTCQRISIITFDWEQNHATILATQGQAETIVGNECQISLDGWQVLITQLENCDRQSDYVVAYLSQLPLLSQLVPALTQAKLDCFISFPLKARGKLLGILKVWLENLATISPTELEMVSEVCNQVAIALEQAYLYHQTQEYALKLEAKVAQRTAQLEEINQELEAFSYSISHDLKAPLRAIQGFATALQEDYAHNLDDLGREYTLRLSASAQHMEKLILDLLTYSRLSRTEIQLQVVSLERIVSQAIEQINLKLDQVQAEITIEEPLQTMFANKTILLQIVTNLLSNALKFVAVGVKPQIRIWTEMKGDRVRLCLADNGIGIAPQHQERIFGVFERLHGNETYPGTGIGLAIVKKGMERLAGSFGVESELGKGSCFWVEGAKTQ